MSISVDLCKYSRLKSYDTLQFVYKYIIIIIIIMYLYHALINALSTHMIHINLHVYDILYSCRA